MKTLKIHPLKINFEIAVSPVLKLPRFVYLFVIEGTNIHFIDTGVASAIIQIEFFLKTINQNITSVKNIFLTHSHPDHIGTAKLIQQESHCSVYAPKDEIEWIINPELQSQQRPVPGFNNLVSGPVTVNHILNNGQIIQLEKNISVKIISTPGHSAGSTSFYFKEQNVLFCGDSILLPGELPIFENIKDYLNSLDKIKVLNPHVLYSSWDEPRYENEITEIIDKSRAYILGIQKAAIKVSKNFEETNSIDFCKAVLSELGQNESLANPLLIKSFRACL